MCGEYPVDFNYDDDMGVNILYDNGKKLTPINLSHDEMTAPMADAGPNIFGSFEKIWRSKIHQEMAECK
jgi:hypothetical protein